MTEKQPQINDWYDVDSAEAQLVRQAEAAVYEQRDEQSLRPQHLADYIGQTELKEELTVYITAAKQREEALDHVLLYGPPGLGKTTLAMIIANEMGVQIKTTTGPAIDKSGDLLALLNELEAGDILFIDEIHRLSTSVEEMLYSAMEDFFVDIMVGQGPTARAVHFPLPPFTLIGATTRPGMLSKPLRDRFGIMNALQYYTADDLAEIVTRSAQVLEAPILPEGAHEVALRSRGTPRIANRLLRRVRDFAQVDARATIDHAIVAKALDKLRVDHRGLDRVDHRFLETVITFYHGGPVGLQAVAANIGEETETLESLIEPYLLQIGFVQRTPRGRVVTDAAYTHLGLTPPTKERS